MGDALHLWMLETGKDTLSSADGTAFDLIRGVYDRRFARCNGAGPRPAVGAHRGDSNGGTLLAACASFLLWFAARKMRLGWRLTLRILSAGAGLLALVGATIFIETFVR
jgi:hypothetical protein